MNFSRKKVFKNPINVMASSAIAFTALVSPIAVVIPGINGSTVQASTLSDISVTVDLGVSYKYQDTVFEIAGTASWQDVRTEVRDSMVKIKNSDVVNKNPKLGLDGYRISGSGYIVPAQTGKYVFTVELKNANNTFDWHPKQDSNSIFIYDNATNKLIASEGVTPNLNEKNANLSATLEVTLEKGKIYKVNNSMYKGISVENGATIETIVTVTTPGFETAFPIGAGNEGSTAKGVTITGNDLLAELTTGKMRIFQTSSSAQIFGTNVVAQENVINQNLTDAKNKVEGLFTDDQHNAIKPTTDAAAIDAAENAVNKLPAGDEKSNLQDLVNKAKDLLDQKTKAEQDLANAKSKVEGLFTDDQFNTLKDTTNQASLDEAQEAVDQLQAGDEKDRLQGLIDVAKELLDQKTKAEQDLADAKSKVEGLFTDNQFNHLKDSTSKTSIDEAQAAVDKLSAGDEKDRLQGLIDDANELLDQKSKAEQNLAEAKNKVEDLFTNNQFNMLKDTTNQALIDEAQEAVDIVQDGDEKDRLQGLIDKAQELLDQKTKAEQDLLNATNKVEGLFTDDQFDKLKDSTNQAAIDEAQEAVDKLPDGDAKDQLQGLLDKAKELISELSIRPDSLIVGQTTVTGTVSPNTARVYIYLNDEFVRYRPIDNDGTFSGHVSNNLKAGDIVRLVPADVNGRFGQAIEVTVENNQALGAPTINKYVQGNSYLTGKATNGTAFVRVYINDKLLRKRNVEANGEDLLVYLLDGNAKAGDQIKVVPFDANSIAGKETIITVQAPPIEIKAYVEGDEQIFGKTTPNADKIDIYVNGTLLRTRAIDKTSGDFYGSMRSTVNGLPKSGDVIKIIARTDKGVILSESELTVGIGDSKLAPTAQDFIASQKSITGTVPQGAQKMRIYYGTDFKEFLNRGTVDKVNLTYTIYVADLSLKSGDQVKIVSIDSIGRESAPVIVNVK